MNRSFVNPYLEHGDLSHQRHAATVDRRSWYFERFCARLSVILLLVVLEQEQGRQCSRSQFTVVRLVGAYA
jgi:hypothetical protein